MLAKLAIKRPVTTIMVIFIAILSGIVALLGLSIDLMPAMDIPIAAIITTYVGAGPEEIESLITEPLEEALGTVPKVETISSQSSSNISLIIVELEDGADLDMISLDMREKIDSVKSTLPEDANAPFIYKIDVTAMTDIYIGISADMDIARLSNEVEDNIVNRLKRVEGVAAVSLIGNTEKEIEVRINPEKLKNYGLTSGQIAAVLGAENVNYPTGKVLQGNTSLQLRSIGEFQSVDEIRNLPIITATGAVIYLSDVADVNEVVKDNESYTAINGRESIVVSISKQSNANLVNVSDALNKELEAIKSEYPDFSIAMLSDTSSYIKTSVKNVLYTATEAAIMAVIIIFLFLRNPKTSAIIGVSIPTSVIFTFAIMYLNNMTMNIISLGGITIGIGMLVDNSIVVLENIYRFYELGYPPKEASELGASEISMSVTASTLTTVAVFIPFIFVKGWVGQIFSDLALSISFSLIVSLVVSLSFVPMACSLFLGKEKRLSEIKEEENATDSQDKKGKITKLLDKWGKIIDSLDERYRKLLAWALLHKKKTIITTIVIFICTLLLTPIMGFDLFPGMDQGMATISIEMPKGTEIKKTTEMVEEVTGRLSDIEEIKDSYVLIGGGLLAIESSSDTATVNINLVEKAKRNKSTDEVVELINSKVKDIAGAKIKASASSSAMGDFGGASLSFQVTGDDMDVLRKIDDEIIAALSKIPGISEATSSAEDSVPEANIVINRSKASAYGITAATVGGAISSAVTGTVATRYKVGGTEIDVRIKRDKDTINYINDIKNLTVTSPTGIEVPLMDVADIVIKDSSTSITRLNQQRYVSISATISDRATSDIKEDIIKVLDKYNFPEGYDYNFAGVMESMDDVFSSLGIVLIVAVLLVYMIMASQFESLKHPFTIMFSVPLALTGGIFGLFITGNSISSPAFMGFIMLVGMVVNNAIVLVDYTNRLREEGMESEEALLKAGPTRLRPILMTTLTTIIGLLPMAVNQAEGTEMQNPLAISVIFGLTISTMVTLIFIPVLYSIMDKKRPGKLIKRFKFKKKEAKTDPQ